MGAITAYAGLMAKRTGYKALYLSGGGVAANSLGVPDLGISTMEDVLTDARRIVDATQLPLLVDIDTGWGGAFNIGRTIRSFINVGVAAVHMEDQVGQKRCGHRPGKEVVTKDEMVDRVKAAVDARTDAGFVIMARTDAAAVEGVDAAIERAVRLRRSRRRHDLPRSDEHARRLPPLQGRGEGADPGQPHRVRLHAVLHHRRAARAPTSTSPCTAAARTAR